MILHTVYAEQICHSTVTFSVLTSHPILILPSWGLVLRALAETTYEMNYIDDLPGFQFPPSARHRHLSFLFKHVLHYVS